MNEDTNNPPSPDNTPQQAVRPPYPPSQDLQTPAAGSNPQQPNMVAPQYQNLFPHHPTSQMQADISASQLGLNESRGKLFKFTPKQLIIWGIIGLAILGCIVTALILTNSVALSEFKTVNYANSKGTNYELSFYSKHSTRQLDSGNTQLVSKVSKNGKFPVVLSISTSDGVSAYNRVKDCTGFAKVFDVKVTSLNRTIPVCDLSKQGQLPGGGIYIAGFMHDEKAQIITISQDYGDVDLSSQSGAKESLEKCGMDPYRQDIENIVSSIEVR